MMIKVNVKGRLATGFARNGTWERCGEKRGEEKDRRRCCCVVIVDKQVAVGNEKNNGIVTSFINKSFILDTSTVPI